ncbi:MAG: class I SAM-dependent methyltransferase [bacterium]
MFQKRILQTVFNRIKGCPFQVTYWDGETYSFNDNGEQPIKFNLIINEKLNLNEIRKSPQLKLGEAYMKGKIEVEGKLRKVLEVGAKNVERLEKDDGEENSNKFWQKQQESTKEEQEEGVRDHYDLGNDFFQLWQDETMTYSCAYFKTPEDSLKQAQIQKIDHILKKLNFDIY